VWGGFSASGVGILTAEKYIDVLESEMLASADMLFGRVNWTFQQDNDPKHTAKVTKVWFEENEVLFFY
jgi:hypothetical protein